MKGENDMESGNYRKKLLQSNIVATLRSFIRRKEVFSISSLESRQ